MAPKPEASELADVLSVWPTGVSTKEHETASRYFHMARFGGTWQVGFGLILAGCGSSVGVGTDTIEEITTTVEEITTTVDGISETDAAGETTTTLPANTEPTMTTWPTPERKGVSLSETANPTGTPLDKWVLSDGSVLQIDESLSFYRLPDWDKAGITEEDLELRTAEVTLFAESLELPFTEVSPHHIGTDPGSATIYIKFEAKLGEQDQLDDVLAVYQSLLNAGWQVESSRCIPNASVGVFMFKTDPDYPEHTPSNQLPYGSFWARLNGPEGRSLVLRWGFNSNSTDGVTTIGPKARLQITIGPDGWVADRRDDWVFEGSDFLEADRGYEYEYHSGFFDCLGGFVSE